MSVCHSGFYATKLRAYFDVAIMFSKFYSSSSFLLLLLLWFTKQTTWATLILLCLNRRQISITLIATVFHLRMEIKKDYGHNFNSKKVKIENNDFVVVAKIILNLEFC